MILGLLGAHILGVVAAGVVGRRSMRAALAVAAVAPLITTVWVAWRLVDGAEPGVAELMWVEGLGLSLRFRVGAMAELMTLLVSGIGALVFVYAIGYFGKVAGGVRFPATLLAFSVSMLGMVWAESIWTLFIFWELTSVTSFLLIGHKHTDPAVSAAARTALMITGAGGLVLLAGLLVLANDAGTANLTELHPATGTTAWLAAVLILVGAATKSAQVPFHVWLPGAMAAPTPVSAYLHSATMVKAGVLVVALMGQLFADTAAWKTLGAAFGVASMLWGAVGALRHRDAKLILAWGTVSQLGLMVTLFSVGSAKAAFAGLAILLAHGLFKAALFLVVGEVDVRTGTRDIAVLSGLWRSMPVAFGVAVAAGVSMAGAPPLIGFMAKEAAIEAALGLSGTERLMFTGAIVAGSVLTVAYTTRLLVGVFGPGSGGAPVGTAVGPRRMTMVVPSVLCAAGGIVGYFVVSGANRIVSPAAIELNAKADAYELIQWPGLTNAFVISVAVLLAGAALGVVVVRRGVAPAPSPVGADRADRLIDGVLNWSPRITALFQHGSLPVYVATMGLAALIATIPFFASVSDGHLVWWDQPLEPVIGVAVVGSAAVGTVLHSRLGAALTLGAVGLGISALFVVRGAPDLALTQLLVETIVVVAFVLGLGRLRRRFPATTNTWRTIRVLLAGAGGLAVTASLASAGARSAGRAPVDELTEAAVDEGGGKNVVNVILTDIRALDTLGEVVVLATVAVGVLALARINRLERAR